MACSKPLSGYRCSNNGWSGKPQTDYDKITQITNMQIPCGQCYSCRMQRSGIWTTRLVHENTMHKQSCFITLTYSPENMPLDYSLDLSHFQQFLKRLRERIAYYQKKYNLPSKLIKFYHCGEYGSENKRPHYHALIFGFDFNDKTLHSQTRGIPLYRSPLLEDLWDFGFSTTGEVTPQSAGYCARYIMKKQLGRNAEAYYTTYSDLHGRDIQLKPEYTSMSNGIGKQWYEKYKSEVFPADNVLVNGKLAVVPPYYSKIFQREDPEGYEKMKTARLEKMELLAPDNTPKRLKVKEQCLKARTKSLIRSL